MSLTPKLTVAQARSEIIKRLGLTDDGLGQPELLAQITGHIAASQRALVLEHRHLLARRTTVVPVASGRRWYPLMVDPEGILSVSLLPAGSSRIELSYGLTLDDALETDWGIPERFDIRLTTGVTAVNGIGGTGYTNGAAMTFDNPGATGGPATGTILASGGAITGKTITDPGAEYVTAPTVTVAGGTGATLTAILGDVEAIFLDLIPEVGGSLVIESHTIPASSLLDADSLTFDSEAVITTVAAMVAPSINSQLAQVLVAAAGNYRKLIASKLRPRGAGISMRPARHSRTG